MSPKSISMSVRLSPDDAATLATLKVPEAATPSDKIRALIRLAEAEMQPGKSYADQLSYQDDKLGEIYNAVLTGEARHAVHSELLALVGRWLPEMLAFYVASGTAGSEPLSRERLLQLEQGAADRVFLLFDNVLRLAVTGSSPCYDPQAVVSRARNVTALAPLISRHLSKNEDDNC